MSFVKNFRNTFIIENLLQIGFGLGLLKMENRHSYYNKNISRSRPLFQKTGIARESVYLRIIYRKLTLNFPSKRLLVLKTSSRRLQDMSSRRLQHVFSVTILRLPRRLEDVLKTCLEDVLKTCLEDMS